MFPILTVPKTPYCFLNQNRLSSDTEIMHLWTLYSVLMFSLSSLQWNISFMRATDFIFVFTPTSSYKIFDPRANFTWNALLTMYLYKLNLLVFLNHPNLLRIMTLQIRRLRVSFVSYKNCSHKNLPLIQNRGEKNKTKQDLQLDVQPNDTCQN